MRRDGGDRSLGDDADGILGKIKTVFSRRGLERFVADPNGLQRIVGIIIGTAAVFADISNILVNLGSSNGNIVASILDWYVISITLLGISGVISIFWKSPIARWIQVSVFLITAILSALTVRGGDLTSGFFIIFGLVLIFEYGFGRYGSWIGVVFALLFYPLALAIGFSKDSSAFLAQSASIMLIIACLIVLYGSVLIRHELRHRQDRDLLETRVKERTAELESALAERSVMLREIHHRVKNNLQIISSILQLEADREESPVMRASREKSIQRIYAMALVHETLYQTDQLENIDLARYADRLIDDVRAGSSIEFILSAEGPILVGLDFAVAFGLLLNELVTNAQKHAFPRGFKGRVDIGIESEEGIKLTVADYGAGIAEDIRLEGAKTLGLNLVTALAEQLHGRIDLERKSGTKWTILFPEGEEQAFLP
jgi:two-component sensor histidine kinase